MQQPVQRKLVPKHNHMLELIHSHMQEHSCIRIRPRHSQLIHSHKLARHHPGNCRPRGHIRPKHIRPKHIRLEQQHSHIRPRHIRQKHIRCRS